MQRTVLRALLAGLALAWMATLGGCADATDPMDRAARIEWRLLVSCTCHPKQIRGLPLEAEIRAAISEGIAAGLDDGEILWQVLQSHGNALLRAGIEDLETRARVFAAESAGMVLAGLAVLLLQLRRRHRVPARSPG